MQTAQSKSADAPDFDVFIVGAGISGIGMAAHLEMECPDRSYMIAERRDNLGGTWDLFRYPGIRSDSDMHTLGFKFEPWTHEKSIADAPAILEYLNRIADERGIRDHIRFGKKVLSANWSDDDTRWHIVLEDKDGKQSTVTAGFVYLGSGYYDYDNPYEAQFAGRSDFAGEIVHPQFWPEDMDYSGKKVVVIGSGATAVTIVPVMAETAAKVTMLQRTPTWCISAPARDPIANTLRKILPGSLAYRFTRWKNVLLQDVTFKKARSSPEKVANVLTKRLKKNLGDSYEANAASFKPPYNPWEQRLCLVPDADLFEAIKSGKAEVVTDHIEKFEANGIRLKSGDLIEADIVVTATGLTLAIAGKIDVRVNGSPVEWKQHFYYKGCMFSNIPNLAVVFGYLNASWTLRADINSEYVCKLLNVMKAKNAAVALPYLAPDHDLEEHDIFDFSSGYIERGKSIMPKTATSLPWQLTQDYRQDRKNLANLPVDDGVLQFKKAAVPAQSHQLEPAE